MKKQTKLLIALLVTVGLYGSVHLLKQSSYNKGLIEGCNKLVKGVVPFQLQPVCELLDGQLVVTVTNPLDSEDKKSVNVETGELVE